MRIAQVAPLAESVPPKLYGGTERVIAWLTEELIELGHDVTLFASGDSATSATLVPVWPRALRLGRPKCDPAVAETALLELVGLYAQRFDVIHCHTNWTHLPLLTRLGVPFLTTLHNRLDTPGLPDVVARFPAAPFISISDDQRKPLSGANWLRTIYHGLPADSLRPSLSAGSYLAFLGRLSRDKGPETAIRLARAAKMPLRIAAKLPRAERGYFKEQVEPLIDGKEIQIVGEVNERTKENFLANASALLFPIDWPEPFGLVMIEAMACGTPVIAFRRGSVPEVVDHGVTGFIVDDEQEGLQAINRLPELDRSRVRADFERRFTARRMAEDYVRHYHLLLENGPGRATVCDMEGAAKGQRAEQTPGFICKREDLLDGHCLNSRPTGKRARELQIHGSRASCPASIYAAVLRTVQCVWIYLALLAGLSCEEGAWAQLGLVLGGAIAIRLVCGPIAGRIADRLHAFRAELAVCAILGASAAILFLVAHGFWAVLAITLFQAAALAPLVPLADALSLAHARPQPNLPGFEYGWVRGAGSAGFVAGTLLAGHAANRYGLSVIMWLSAAALLALPFATKFVPAFPEGSGARALGQERPDRPWLLLRQRVFGGVTLVGALVLGSHAMYDSFAVIRWRGTGISPATIGLLWSEAVAAEVLVFLLIGTPLSRVMKPTGALC